MLEHSLRADLTALPAVARAIREELAHAGVEASIVHAVDLALEELLTNTIRHGYPRGHAGQGSIRLQLAVADDEVRVRIQDDGAAFDPTAAPLPEPPSSLASARVGGQGIRLVRSAIRDMRYRRTPEGNELELVLRPEPGRDSGSP